MKEKLIFTLVTKKKKVMDFFKEERSARGFAEEGHLTYGNVIMGIIVLLIASVFIDDAFNAVGNIFNDGVNGTADQTNLNQWSDSTDGFNRE